MVDAQTLSIVFAGLSIAASILYYANVLRNANNARQRELIFQKYQSYSIEYAKTFHEVSLMRDWKDYDEFEEKYGREVNIDASAKWLYIMRVYNLAGLYLREGADPDLIFELYPPVAVINLWELFEPIIQGRRERSNDPGVLRPLELLYREAKSRFPEIRRSSLNSEERM
jgi:hypothetical protein